jgi:transposase
MMLGRRKRLEPKLFYTGLSLDSRIPDDHPLRRIRQVVDFDFVRAEVADLYGGKGNPSIDPAVLLKLMVVLFLENVSSERALMQQMAYRMDWLWFCGYDVDEAVPNHSVLSKARRRWGVEVFSALFKRILHQCVEAGLVEGALLHVDGSVIAANASMDTLQAHLRVVGEDLYETLDQALDDKQDQAAESAEASGEDDPPLSKSMVSETDPDARLTRKNGKTVLGYKEHRVVDDAHGVITATATTDASVDESHMLQSVLDQHRFNTGLIEDRVAADKGYGTRDVYKMLHGRSITPCIPHQKYGGTHKTWSTDRFIYNAKMDCYICPAGHELHRKSSRRKRRTDTIVRYYASKPICDACPYRSRCTENENGRTVVRHPDQRYVEWADTCLPRAERRRLQGRRRAVAEGSFADASNNHGYKRARWRSRVRVEIQNLLIATVQNIRKLLARTPRKRPDSVSGLSACLQAALWRPLGTLLTRWKGYQGTRSSFSVMPQAQLAPAETLA